MTKKRWVLLAVAAAVGLAAGAMGSCAIDDEVTWIDGQECTGGCTSRDTGAFSCDVDSSCTPAEGCVDWDCGDQAYSGPPEGGVDDGRGIDTTPGDGGLTDVGDANGDGGDDGATGDSCTPSGGGETRETAESLTLGVTLGDRTACSVPSRWYRFAVDAAVRFAVELVPAAGAVVEFLLYAEDGSVVAAAGMGAEADFAADAGAVGTYLLRVRAEGDNPVGYALTVRALP
jgi:hypothetical protein